MIWIDKNSTEEDVLEILRTNFGLMKRSYGMEIAPTLPYKRPLSMKETNILRKYFGVDYKWTDIDKNGMIILINPSSSVLLGTHFVTEEDLKKQIEREG